MRVLIEHTRTYSVADSIMTLLVVNVDEITTATNKRSVFIHAFGRDGGVTNYVYVFGTMAGALTAITNSMSDAEKTAAGVMAYTDDWTPSGNPQSLMLTNHAGVPPDLTGLRLQVNGSGDSTDYDGVWFYMDSPEAAVLAEIESVLESYMGSGQALAGFSTARVLVGPEELTIASAAPLALIAMVDSPETVRQAGKFALEVNWTVIVGARGVTNAGSDAYMEVLGYAGAVRSILGDENITLNGVTIETVIGNIAGPRPVFGIEEPYLASAVSGKCRFPSLDSDA